VFLIESVRGDGFFTLRDVLFLENFDSIFRRDGIEKKELGALFVLGDLSFPWNVLENG